MASDNEASCESDPNFAVICAFMEKFGTTCGLQSIDFLELQEMLENTQEVPQELIDLHIKLLRKSRKTVSNERWEKAIIKFCHTFCVQDAWEIERFGYKKARLSSKLRVLKELLEMQFDYNTRFKAEINKMSAEELRSQPLGKDKQGHAYWFQNDNNCQIRVYKEDPDEETWTLVAKDREGLAALINELSDGDSKFSSESATNEEDSNSLAEKPIIDTGQVDTSSSDSNKKLSTDSENSNESKGHNNISRGVAKKEELTNGTEKTKRTRECDEENNSEDVKRAKIEEDEEEEEEVGEAIEEPIMLVKGEGSGKDNECVNPIIGEEIEEDLMFFYGEGNGVDCETGNEDNNGKTSSDAKNNQSSDTRDTCGSGIVSISDSKNCVVNNEVPTSPPVKSPYKLGTIIDTKTDNKFFSSTGKSTTKTSRWDVETIISKDVGKNDEIAKKQPEETSSSATTSPKKFFFGPGCLQFSPATVGFGQKVPAEETEKKDEGYRIEKKVEEEENKRDNKIEYDCVQSGGDDAGHLDDKKEEEKTEETPLETALDKLNDEKINTNHDVDAATEEETKAEETRINSDELDETRSKLEEQIISEETDKEECDNKLEEIPEVTATLVGYEENDGKSKNDTEEENEETKPNLENNPEVVPVVEDTCTKKQAYVCGEETEKDSEEQQSKEIEETPVEELNPKQDVNIDENKNEQLESKNEEQSSEKLESSLPKEDKEEDDDSIKNEIISTNEEKGVDVDQNLLKSEDNPPLDETKEVETKNEDKKEEEEIVKPEKATNDDLKIEEKKAPDKNEPKKEAIVYLKKEDKLIEEKKNNEETGVKRGRKNNSNKNNEQPMRRTTRSSKNEEPFEEKTLEAPTRRGRGRASKTEKQETAEADGNKKMKMSNEEENVPKTKRGKQTEKEESEKIESEKEKMKTEGENGKNENEKVKIGIEEITKIGEEEEDKMRNEEEESPKMNESVILESSNSSDVVEIVEDRDPLAVSDDETKTQQPMTLSNFSLDFNESPAPPTPPLTRSGLRKRGRESPQNLEETEATGGKRLKMKAKRAVDVKLRKSIEEQKKKDLVSSDDENKSDDKKEKKEADEKNEETIIVSSDEKEKVPARKKKKASTMNKNKRLLANLGIDPKLAILDFGADCTSGVRQSRRIAQLKIKEEAERRKLEEEMAQEIHKKKKSKKSEDKDYKAEKKRTKHEEEEEEDAAEYDSTDSKKKRKRKKKKKDKLMFDEFNPWKSSSGSSSSDEEVEEEEEIIEDDDDEELKFVSDHEFSPESDIEGDGEAQPLKRARTARKESDVEEVDDCPCQKCGKSDHPEWILLCDSCDSGWHCSCLRPPLLVIPEGDWFCPPCQHSFLLKNLQEKLGEYDKKLNKKEIEDRRRQRLAYVGISLNNVLPTKDSEIVKKQRKQVRKEDDDEYEDDADEDDEEEEGGEESSEEGSESNSSASESDSDEPIYQLRQRRQAQSYKFNDFDDLINSAIQDEMEAVKGAGNQGRGKDISTIVNAEKEEERKKEEEENVAEEPPEALPPVVPLNEKDKEPKPLYEDDDGVQAKKKKIIGRKKHRKLNSLDISDEDDEDSDEDFKGTSTDSDDDFDEDLGSEDSDDLDTGRGRRRGIDPVRRSTRARTSRYDADFIDDESSDSEDIAPRRKKKRSFWDESESEESDRSWGRRKRKPANRSKKPLPTTTKKKKSKKKKKNDSDEEVYRKKKPKIKYGLDNDDDGPVRRTRGKKINYIDALGSDSDDDRGKRPPPRIESDEEYVAEDDEKNSEEEIDQNEKHSDQKQQKIQIQSYTDARFTEVLPEPKNQLTQFIQDELDGELNPIDQINRNVEMMDENEMEKMMEDEEYANKHLQMVAQQLEKEKRRKEREAKKMESQEQPPLVVNKNTTRNPKEQFQFTGSMQEPLVGNVDTLIVNSENNDELSEPPGVSLPLFDELGASSNDGLEEQLKKRRAKAKKTLEETVASLGSARRQETTPPQVTVAAAAAPPPPPYMSQQPTDLSAQNSNLEIAAPPQPFSQSQPTPSVITRMLQSKPGQAGYPVGTIRPKQFAVMQDRDEEVHHTMASSPVPHTQYIQASGLRPQVSSPYRHMPANMNHYPRAAAPQIRNPVTSMYHSQHRPLDPSPSGGGAINIPPTDLHNSPGRVTVSPAASSPGSNKNETPPPPPYSRPPSTGGVRFPPRHIIQQAMVPPPPHLQQPPRPNMSPYHHPPPGYHYGGQYGGQEDALPPTVYQSSPYAAAPEQFDSHVTTPSDNSNSKTFDEESAGGEFGGLVSYFSSQREDDLES